MSQNNHTGMDGARRPVNQKNIKKNKQANDQVLEMLKKLADADK